MVVCRERILIMKTFKLILLLSLVFFAGLVAGVVGTRVIVRHMVREVILHPDRAQEFMEHNLARKLRLDPGQQIKLHEILTTAHGQLKDLRREYQPQFFEVLSNANGQIVAILTPEQQAVFDKLKSENKPLLQAIQQNR
jgi:hypothetical protein